MYEFTHNEILVDGSLFYEVFLYISLNRPD
jgi:hypothetical protein